MSSIILGTLASVLPNLLFFKLYFYLQTTTPAQFIKVVYLCEVLKFAGMALSISAFLQWPGLQIVKFFSAFLLFEVVRLLCLFLWGARMRITNDR